MWIGEGSLAASIFGCHQPQLRAEEAMIVEDQSETIAFLKRAVGEGLHGEAVETFETHISIVVLGGKRALKLKRAVRLPYVDLSTAEQRLAIAKREVSLNRRTAPKLYVGVRRVTRQEEGRLALDGQGTLVDVVVEMVRFDQDDLFDRMALRGVLTPALLTKLAGEIGRFHREVPADSGQSGASNIDAVLVINERSLATTHVFALEAVAAFNAAFRKALLLHASLLDRRAQVGKVRHCHGDLHLRNICLFAGAPTLFDCLEFSDSMATIDVLYDLAFLLMDLERRDLRNEANLVFNRYLDEADESDGLPLVPFFMALRAAVRAHVTATAAEEATDEEAAISRRGEAQGYFDRALALLEPKPAMLVAIGGFSGSGKSTVAAAVAPAIGSPPARASSRAIARANVSSAWRRRRACRRALTARMSPSASMGCWRRRRGGCSREATVSSAMRSSTAQPTARGSPKSQRRLAFRSRGSGSTPSPRG
jgi:aminoglycoside phosphotransferase family enzyme